MTLIGPEVPDSRRVVLCHNITHAVTLDDENSKSQPHQTLFQFCPFLHARLCECLVRYLICVQCIYITFREFIELKGAKEIYFKLLSAL